MSVIFVSELEEVRLRLGWEHPLSEKQQMSLRDTVLHERGNKRKSVNQRLFEFFTKKKWHTQNRRLRKVYHKLHIFFLRRT